MSEAPRSWWVRVRKPKPHKPIKWDVPAPDAETARAKVAARLLDGETIEDVSPAA